MNEELTALIEKWKLTEAIKGGTNQDNDIWWGELCFELTPLLVAEVEAQAERIKMLEAENADLLLVARESARSLDHGGFARVTLHRLYPKENR